jgi:hypothetical protein
MKPVVLKSRDGLVSIVTKLRAGRPRSQSLIPSRGSHFSLLHNAQTSFGIGTVSYSIGTGDPVVGGVKRLGHEVDRSPLSSVEVKNDGAIPPLSHVCSWISA